MLNLMYKLIGGDLVNLILKILGIIDIGYFILVNLFFGGTTFSWFYLVLGIGLIAYTKYIDKLLAINSLSSFIKPARIVIGILLIVFVVSEIVIISYPKRKEVVSDYIVVLGAGIRGENLSVTLRERLNAALEVSKKIDFKGKFVLTGGQGPNESITEAEAMRRYLEEKGVPSDRILLEDKATSTYENFKYSKNIIEKDSNRDIKDSAILVTTTDFHAFRSNILAKRNGYSNVDFYTSKSEWYLVPATYAREFFALGKSLVFDK